MPAALPGFKLLNHRSNRPRVNNQNGGFGGATKRSMSRIDREHEPSEEEEG